MGAAEDLVLGGQGREGSRVEKVGACGETSVDVRME